MNEQEKTTRQARIDTAREGLRSALVGLAKAEKRVHDAASDETGSGCGTPGGHSAPAGQWPENQ